jgi:Glycopeptide antibiotics resistance protein
MQHAEAREKSRVRLTIGLTVLVAYSGLILAITLSPTQLDVNYQNAVLRLLEVLHRNGIPSWFGYGEVEFLANVGMFIPFGFLVALLLPQRLSILTVLIGPGFSAFIENFQREFLSERVASVYDVYANSAGAVIGFLLAATLRAVVHARDRRIIARALWQYENGERPTGR